MLCEKQEKDWTRFLGHEVLDMRVDGRQTEITIRGTKNMN